MYDYTFIYKSTNHLSAMAAAGSVGSALSTFSITGSGSGMTLVNFEGALGGVQSGMIFSWMRQVPYRLDRCFSKTMYSKTSLAKISLPWRRRPKRSYTASCWRVWKRTVTCKVKIGVVI